MGVGIRGQLASQLIAHGWPAATPAAIVCDGHRHRMSGHGRGASTEWATPRLGGAAGVLVVGEVVRIREALAGTAAVNDVKTGRTPLRGEVGAIDHSTEVGRGRLSFADERDIDEFVDTTSASRARRDFSRGLAQVPSCA